MCQGGRLFSCSLHTALALYLSLICSLLEEPASASSSCNLAEGGFVDVRLPHSGQHVRAAILQNSADLVFYAVREDIILGELECNCDDDHIAEECLVLFIPGGSFAASERHLDQDRALEVFKAGAQRHWADAVVYYEISEEIESPFVEAVHAAAWAWTQNSPVRMIESSEAHDRVIISGNHLESMQCGAAELGRKGGKQILSLNLYGKCQIGNIVHEMGHSIGWFHEHLRPDRNDYITVKEELIMDGYESNYNIRSQDHYGAHPYDYGSLMHYPAKGFSTDPSENVIQVNEERFQAYKEKYPNDLIGDIGQRILMSTIDKQMGYTYLSGCHNDNNLFFAENETRWHISPWGGCAAAVSCGGPAFRERFVTCRHQGGCVDENKCEAAEKPPTRQACEFASHNLNVTFDEPSLGDVGMPLSNALFYDQLDWQLWSGPLPKLSSPGAFSMPMDYHSKGPLGDASDSGGGRYLWFSGRSPAKQNDQAWYETPVVSTTSIDPCSIDFDWFVHGNSGMLRVELVSCSDCQNRQIIWTSEGTTGQWTRASISLPVVRDSPVRVRFTAARGAKGKYSNVGLDNIAFSESCIRSNLEEVKALLEIDDPGADMVFPYNLTSYCIHRSLDPFEWGILEISLLSCGIMGLCTLCSVILHCCILRTKMKRKIQHGTSVAEIQKAKSVLKAMNVRTLSAICADEATGRLGSAMRLPVEAAAVARDSFIHRKSSFGALSPHTSFGELRHAHEQNKRLSFHKNKSMQKMYSARRSRHAYSSAGFKKNAGAGNRWRAFLRSILHVNASKANIQEDTQLPISRSTLFSEHKTGPKNGETIHKISISERSIRGGKSRSDRQRWRQTRSRDESKKIFSFRGMNEWVNADL